VLAVGGHRFALPVAAIDLLDGALLESVPGTIAAMSVDGDLPQARKKKARASGLLI
jgi:hypothetical protein